jgi:hypothetical protein
MIVLWFEEMNSSTLKNKLDEDQREIKSSSQLSIIRRGYYYG